MEEIRPIKPDELDEFNRLTRTSFGTPPEFASKIPEEWTLYAFVDGKMANTFAFLSAYNGI